MATDDKKRYLILKDPNIYKGLTLLALPLMLNNFIKTIHDLIDMFFVSKIENYSAEAVSSISITFPVNMIFISLGIGLSIAGTSFMSQLVGGNQRQEARKYATNLFAISVIVGMVLNVIAFFGAPLLMKLIGAEGYLLEKSSAYIQIRSFELVSVFIFFAFTSIRQSDGDTVTPVVFGVVTMIINIILSPILIMVFDLGVEGAAYATLIGNTIILPFILYQLFFSKKGLTVSFKEFKPSTNISLGIIKTALPASFGQAFTAIGFLVLNSVIISYGTQTVAAFSVGNRISSLILHPVMAIGGILAAFIGQNIGNVNPERARESFHKALKLSVTIMIFFSTILMFLREPLASIFLEDDQMALDLAVKYLFFLLIGLPLMAVFQTFLGTFNGTGKTKYTFIVSFSRLWLMRIPIILLFKYFTDLGSSGIWTAMLISNFLVAFVGLFFYKKLDFKPRVELDV